MRRDSLQVDLTKVKVAKNELILEDAIAEGEKYINEYFDIHVTIIKANFDENVWIFRSKIFSKTHIFNFGLAERIIKFTKITRKKELLLLVKCWISKVLSETSLQNAYSSFFDMLSIIHTTNGLSNASLEKFSDMINDGKYYGIVPYSHKVQEFELTENAKLNYLSSFESFLIFIKEEKYKEYHNQVLILKSKIKVERKTRQIPFSQDVLKFKKYVEHWVEEIILEENKEELIRFFPAYLWWTITTIIPMRPTEFCLIPRKCLTKKEDMFLLIFPRLKKLRKNENRIKDTYDCLPVPESIAQKIELYIELTNSYAETEYLFSFAAFVDLTREVTVNYSENEIFTNRHLLEVIGKFYRDVIHRKYKVNLNNLNGKYKIIMLGEHSEATCLCVKDSSDNINDLIKPGDLRHIAIINMFLQGYDRVEIQRLAGHFSEETQYHYQKHMQFWVDTQIQQLALEFTNRNINVSNLNGVQYPLIHPKAINDFNKIYKRVALFSGVETMVNDEHKLKIGYCSDENMSCPTFNWRHKGCYLCPHWKISFVEMEQKREEILNDLSLIYDELREKVIFMQVLFNSQLDELGNVETEIKRKLNTTSKEVQVGIINVSKIMYMIGVK